MQHRDQNHGKVFLFRELSEWSEDDKLERTVKIAETVHEHMVIVLGRKDKVTGFVKIVTITLPNEAATVDSDQLIPIRPTPKNKKSKFPVQLLMENEIFPHFKLRKSSCVRGDKVYEVPLTVLEPCHVGGDPFQLQLKNKSYGTLKHVMTQLGHEGL
ncbi:hypothetical protein Daus18300_004088 [Diaporthe australafricana]|uniref:Uncharacterized protein n=1 Tax=Diaporthe australafricana TaxID=127596 RepID=A0ABR3XAH4_9PEZI